MMGQIPLRVDEDILGVGITDQDIKGMLRAGSARLAQRPLNAVNVPQQVRVRETGEVVDIQEPADRVLRQLDKRISVVEKLRGCVG